MKIQKWLSISLGIIVVISSILFTAYLKQRRRDRTRESISEIFYKEKEFKWVNNSFHGLIFQAPNSVLDPKNEITDFDLPGVKSGKGNFMSTGDLSYYVLLMDLESNRYDLENGMRGILSNLIKELNGSNLEYNFRINDTWPFGTAEGSFDHDSVTFILQAFLSFNAIKGHNNLRSLVILGSQNDQNLELMNQSMGSLELDSLKSEKNFLAWSYSKGQQPEKLSDQEDSVTIAKRKADAKNLLKWFENYETEKDGLHDEINSIADTKKASKPEFNYAGSYNEKGNSKADLGDSRGSISDYTEAIRLNPSFSEAYYNRGISKADLRDFSGAIADYSKVIELNPLDADAFYNRGYSKGELKNESGAIADYTQAIELDPSYVGAYYNRGLSKGRFGDFRGSIADFTKVIDVNPSDAGAYFNRGISKLQLGQMNSGCIDLSKARDLGYLDANEVIRNNCK